MSATTRTGNQTIDVSGTPRTPFGRMVRVEARKMLDTRAGFWLLLITGILLLATMGVTLLVVALNDGLRLTPGIVVQVFTIPLSLLLPVFAITTITAEWSQRTGLVTFSHEPHRMRVVLAKLTTVVMLALATIVVAVVLGALTNVLAAGITGDEAGWDLGGRVFVWTVINLLAYFLMAFGLAMLLLSTPGAIAVYYVFALLVPLMVYGPLSFFEWARDTVPWIDMGFAMAPLMSEDPVNAIGQPVDLDATVYAQVLVSVLIWVVLPMVLGGRRVARTELK
jgi:ABC-2 type transport system permease protein